MRFFVIRFFFPLIGFFYILFNPRFNWIKDSLKLISFLIKSKMYGRRGNLTELFNEFRASSWKSQKEYVHQCLNNIALIFIYSLLWEYSASYMVVFLYIFSTSIAGGLGFLFFTVQHNFEHAYAVKTEHWDYYKGALEGSSFLIFPRILNWISADIAYHHIHHLSTAIPNYRLERCQRDLAHLFTEVKRLHLHEVLTSLKYILWDSDQGVIISIVEYRRTHTDGRLKFTLPT